MAPRGYSRHLPGCCRHTWADWASRTTPVTSCCPRLPSSLTIFKHNFLENGAARSEDNWLGGEHLSCVRATECPCPLLTTSPGSVSTPVFQLVRSEPVVHAGVHAWLQVGQVTWDLRMSPAALGAAASTAPGSPPQVLSLLPLFTQAPASPVPVPGPRCRSLPCEGRHWVS